MSLNDFFDYLWNSPAIYLLCLTVGALWFFGHQYLVRKAKQEQDAITATIYGDYELGTVREGEKAKIIAKRTIAHPTAQTIMINMVLFELENGVRVELAIKSSDTYGVMVEGDCGILKHRGKRFIDFERSVPNEE